MWQTLWIGRIITIHHEKIMEVERREEPLNEMTGLTGSDGQHIAIPAASAHKTVKGKLPESSIAS